MVPRLCPPHAPRKGTRHPAAAPFYLSVTRSTHRGNTLRAVSGPHRGEASTTFSLGRRVAAEAIGTFALVFAGTGAIVVDGLTGGDVTHLGVALAFGLVVMTMIHAMGDVSGAHLNPAVTVGFWASRRFPLRDVPGYVAGQCAGAAAGSLTVAGLFTRAAGVGVTAPAGGPWPSFALEVVLTALLMFVILGVSTGAREKGITAGIAVGAVVALGALVGGPVSGASMNPHGRWGPPWSPRTCIISGST